MSSILFGFMEYLFIIFLKILIIRIKVFYFKDFFWGFGGGWGMGLGLLGISFLLIVCRLWFLLFFWFLVVERVFEVVV